MDVITERPSSVHACVNALNTFAICNCPLSLPPSSPPSIRSPFPLSNIFPFTQCSSPNCCRPLTRTFLVRPEELTSDSQYLNCKCNERCYRICSRILALEISLYICFHKNIILRLTKVIMHIASILKSFFETSSLRHPLHEYSIFAFEDKKHLLKCTHVCLTLSSTLR